MLGAAYMEVIESVEILVVVTFGLCRFLARMQARVLHHKRRRADSTRGCRDFTSDHAIPSRHR
jgi:hypothetical protein